MPLGTTFTVLDIHEEVYGVGNVSSPLSISNLLINDAYVPKTSPYTLDRFVNYEHRLAAPVMGNLSFNGTHLQSSWTAVPYATSNYRVRIYKDSALQTTIYPSATNIGTSMPIAQTYSPQVFRVEAEAAGGWEGYGYTGTKEWTFAAKPVGLPVVSSLLGYYNYFIYSYGAVADATAYDLSYSFSNTNADGVLVVGASLSTVINFQGTHTNRTVYVKMRAKVGSVVGAWSSVSSVAIPAIPVPDVPQLGTVSYANGNLTINFTTSGVVVDSSEISIGLVNPPVATPVTTTGSSVHVYSIAQTTSAQTVYFKIRSNNQTGNGNWTSVQSFVIPAMITYPQGLSGSYDPGYEEVTWNWNAVSGATNYNIQTYVNGGVSTQGYSTTVYYTRIVRPTDATAGAKVRAYVNGVWGDWSPIVTIDIFA